MLALLPFLMALGIGFMHAFEADHLVAVSNIVTRHNNVRRALKDGVFWGLGHTSTILLVGLVYVTGRFVWQAGDFHYAEAGVGGMLVMLGVFRLYKLTAPTTGHEQEHLHPQASADGNAHRLAYGVGLLHGLAGSGTLVLSVLTQIQGGGAGMLYLTLFGLGSVGGMMVAAGVFSVPFSSQLTRLPAVRTGLVLLSSGLCVLLGVRLIIENLS